MALVNSSFTVNVTPGAMPPIVHVSEYDVGRTYTVTINGENGSAFNIPTGTTATIEGTLNGSVGFTQSATISNNQVSFALSESMTAYSGKAWCKIKLTLNDEPIQTCAFVLAVDRAGVEAETVIGAPGFQEQIINAVNAWLDENGGGTGSGLTEEVKQALLDCFENVAWINDDGQTYYDALYAALYPPVDVLSISAVFTQGSAVIYDTDDLDTLKQYLVVTATMTDSTTQTVTNYTLSGALTVGTSTITVSYGGKTTTFTVTVTEAPAQEELWINTLGATGSNANYAFAPFLLPTSTYNYNYAKAITAIELDFIRSGSISVGYLSENPSAGSTYDQTKVHVHETISVSESGVNKLVLSTPMTIPSGAVLLVGIGTDTATFKYGGTMTNGFLYKGNDNKWASQTRTLGINVYRQ